MTRIVTAEYLDGIKEGRQFLRRFPEHDNIPDIKRNLENIKDTMREFSPGPVKDMLKGERDFWQNRLALRIAQRANGARVNI